MGDIKSSADLTWRDFEIDGVPSSGAREPQKSEIRATMAVVDQKVETIETGNGEGLLTFATTSARNAFVHADPGTKGVTAQDLQDGNQYYSNGAAWVLIGPSPAARLVVAESDINAIEARLGTAETAIEATEATAAGLDSRLDATEVDVAAARSELLTLPSDSELASLWSGTVTGEPSSRPGIASGDFILSGQNGRAIRVTGAAQRAPRAVYRLLPAHKYEVLAAARRATNPADPAGDAVSLRAVWLSGSKVPLSAVSLQDVALSTGDGLRLYRKVVSLAAGEGVDIVAAGGAVYFTPYMQTYGSDGVTDILPFVRVTDLTSNTLVSADVTAISARVTSLESLEAGDRLDALESITATPDTMWFGTVGDAAAATIGVTVDRVVVFGSPGTNIFAVYVRTEGIGSFTSADGQHWVLSFAPLSSVDADSGIPADFLAMTNLILPSPTLTGDDLIVEGITVHDGQIGLLTEQTDPVENGLYQWNAADGLLVRAGIMADGAFILAPVTVALGTLESETLSDTTWGLQETSFTVGADPNTWDEIIIQDPNAVRANQWLAGNRVPTVAERAPVARSMEATDIPRYRDWLDDYTPFSRSSYRRMHYVGFVSDTLDAVRPLLQQDWIAAKLKFYDTFVFEQASIVGGEIATSGLRGKRLVFMGNGWKGPNRAFIRSGSVSFLNIGGSEGLHIVGDCVIERMHDRAGSGIRATAAFSDFRADRIWTRNCTTAVALGASAGNYNIGEIKTYDPANEALFTGSAATGFIREMMEGSFTPTFAFATPGTSSFSYSSQIGEYQRVGSWVQVAALVSATITTGTGSGALRISAPFTASSGLFTLAGATSGVDSDITWPNASTMVTPRIAAGQNFVTLGVMKSATSDTDLGAAHFSSGAAINLRYSIRYKV